MAHPKGTPKPPNSGRQKGTANKNTVAVKDMLRAALEELGGQQYLYLAAEREPKAFLNLIGKLIPNEVIGNLTLKHTLELIDLSDTGGDGGEEEEKERQTSSTDTATS